MRRRRFKRPPDESAVYHVVTRTVNGMFLFEDADRETLRRMLWLSAEFSGVQVLTYCLLSNHFHILVRVPAKTPVSDPELARRYRLLHPAGEGRISDEASVPATAAGTPGGQVVPSNLAANAVEATLRRGGPEADDLRKALLRRMNDISEFMKTLKQRFTLWYNTTHARYGTLWAERFKSILVEDDSYALATVAAYIDLNPVRAGLVDDPKDYRWCGYGEALGEGNARIRAGLSGVLRGLDWARVLETYRLILFGKGSSRKADGTEAGEIPPQKVREVLNQGGRLPAATVLRCRVRYFSDGAALGSPGFVGQALRAYQELTGRRTRQAEPHPIGGSDDWSGLATLRGLRRAVFG